MVWPSWPVSATQAWGSMYPWCTGWVVNSRSITRSASANPASMSVPLEKRVMLGMLDGSSAGGLAPAVIMWACSTGASGASAWSMVSTAGSTS